MNKQSEENCLSTVAYKPVSSRECELVLYHQCDVNKHEVGYVMLESFLHVLVHSSIFNHRIYNFPITSFVLHLEQMDNEECKIEMNHLSSG